jgi:hypothetical protein
MVAVLAPKSQIRFHVGDMREVLARLEPEFAQCVVTSPPFWGLRDYKIPPSVWGGDPEHAHDWTKAPWHFYPGGNQTSSSTLNGGGAVHQKNVGGQLANASMGAFCACGAWRGQLGLEPWPSLYVEHVVEAFRAVRRALKKDGVLWLEIGDSYAGSGKGPTGWSGIGDHDERQGFSSSFHGHSREYEAGRRDGEHTENDRRRGFRPSANSDDTRARKSERSWTHYGGGWREFFTGEGSKRGEGREAGAVFTNTSQATSHIGLKPKDLIGIPWMVAFALRADGWYLRQDNIWARPNPMPESVKDRCTRSHSYVFQLSKSRRVYYDWLAIAEPFATDPRENYPGRAHVLGRGRQNGVAQHPSGPQQDESGGFPPAGVGRNKRSVWTIPTTPFREAHFATFPPELCVDPIKATSRPGDVVLDPFCGAGTVALVAARLGRDSVGIDAKPSYIRMAERRVLADCPMFVEVQIEP